MPSRGRLKPIAGWLLTAIVAAQAAAATESGDRHRLSGGSTRRISFLNDVEPILTRAGCNSGPCHGSQFGKGGLKLSLAAYDPDFDYQSISRVAGGRRLNLPEPRGSLLLMKPAMQIAHQGGKRLDRGSADYHTILQWVRQGAPGPNPRDPTPVSLIVAPSRALLRPGASLQLRVRARFSDGSVRAVTGHTRIDTLDEKVAAASPEGKVTAAGPGASGVMLRYGGLAAVAEIIVPYRPRAVVSSAKGFRGKGARNRSIDALVAEKWRELGLTPSPRCDDYTFIRRVSLDIIGTLPTADEVRAFAADTSPGKREQLVNRMLERPEYADYWTIKWADLLRSSRAALGPKAAAGLTEWIRAAFARNIPYDQFVRELVTAQGPANAVAPANYYRVAATPEDLTETTSQLFLGVRLQCARCHHHPFEKWSQSDYYRFAAFFARVGQRPVGPETLVAARGTGEVAHPKTRAVLTAAPLPLEGSPPHQPAGHDRREALATWMTRPDNLPFARMIVNRYWAYFLGRGIVDPVDDVRVTNPPSNPQLLDALARGFVATGFDVKRLIRTICTSRVYQISAEPTPANRLDRKFYSHFLPRRQPAEVLLESISRATGVPERFPGLPAGTRAIQLADPAVSSIFLDTFGRPARSSACECERTGDPTLPQALQLLNGDVVNVKIASDESVAARLAGEQKRPAEVVEHLYLSTLSRPPTRSEARQALAAFSNRPPRQAAEDLLWALLNMKEFPAVR